MFLGSLHQLGIITRQVLWFKVRIGGELWLFPLFCSISDCPDSAAVATRFMENRGEIAQAHQYTPRSPRGFGEPRQDRGERQKYTAVGSRSWWTAIGPRRAEGKQRGASAVRAKPREDRMGCCCDCLLFYCTFLRYFGYMIIPGIIYAVEHCWIFLYRVPILGRGVFYQWYILPACLYVECLWPILWYEGRLY